MTDPISPKEFEESEGVGDWRGVPHDQAEARIGAAPAAGNEADIATMKGRG